MTASYSFIVTGFLFGLSGLIPGPLFTLAVTQTLKHNIKEGIKIAACPALTDTPIMLAAITILSGFSEQKTVMAVISFAGSAFLLYLSRESLFFRGTVSGPDKTEAHSLKKGIIANFLNPAPYMFWFTVGAPTFVMALKEGVLPALLFIAVFYTTLSGSIAMAAYVASVSKNFLKSRYYILMIRFLGLVLLGFAVLFVWNGIKYAGWVGGS